MMNNRQDIPLQIPEGILLVDKPKGKTSFSLVHALRKKTGVQKIGHAGTLDPFATGLMVMLIGKKFTRLSDQYLTQEKEYTCTLQLGVATDSYDCTGKITHHSPLVPLLSQIETVLLKFQGTILQIPPMFSAKKIQGKRLYKLARQGLSVERKAVPITLSTTFIHYSYPLLTLHVLCSKGTYIRSLAHDIGQELGSYAHLTELRRIRSGQFSIEEAICGSSLYF